MKVALLDGGLANQAFQYIFARYYELSHPGERMYLDDSYFGLVQIHNGYELGKVFHLKPYLLSEYFEPDVWEYMLSECKRGKSIPLLLKEVIDELYMVSEVGEYLKFNGKRIVIPCNQYFPEIQDYEGDIYYDGYWINKHWFARFQNEFLKEFFLPDPVEEKNKEYLRLIQTTQSACLHIRRGDFVDLGWVYPLEGYKEMVDKFLQYTSVEWDLFVFSDDILWCKENQDKLGLKRFRTVTYIEGNRNGKNYIDLWLMSQCKGMIVSNSSFCYLAALLNQKKQLVINTTYREI